MKIFEYIRKLFRKILLKLIKEKKKESANKIVVLDKSIEEKFNNEQKKVIAECIRLGLDVNKIAKKKYSAEQMQIIMFGMALKLNTSSFESYSMTPTEMETNLFIEAMNKFLGRSYLLQLINSTGGSLEDDYIRKKINSDLVKKLSEVFAVAPTLLEAAVTEERTEEDDMLDTLITMCKDRGLDYSRLQKDTIPIMTYEYDKLEKELIDKITNECVPLTKIENYTLEPTAYKLMTNEDISFRVNPVTLRINNRLVTNAYRILRDGKHVYLYNHELKPIKIR